MGRFRLTFAQITFFFMNRRFFGQDALSQKIETRPCMMSVVSLKGHSSWSTYCRCFVSRSNCDRILFFRKMQWWHFAEVDCTHGNAHQNKNDKHLFYVLLLWLNNRLIVSGTAVVFPNEKVVPCCKSKIYSWQQTLLMCQALLMLVCLRVHLYQKSDFFPLLG